MAIQHIVVAAFDSSRKEKADIICDGMDDQIRIQEAMDALPSGGGTVELLGGTFHIAMSIKPTKGCRLVGSGAHSILRLTDAPNSLLVADAHSGQAELKVVDSSGFRAGMPITIVSSNFRVAMRIQSITGNTLVLDGYLPETFTVGSGAMVWAFFPVIDIAEDDVVIKDLAIDGNRARRAVYTATYSYCQGTVHVESESGIYIHGGAEDTIVDGCYISNTQGGGIFVNGGGPNQRFVNNKLTDIGDKGIIIVDVSGPGLISGNYIDGTGRTTNYVSAKSVWGYGDCINLHPMVGDGWLVTNNILKNALRSGIRMEGASKSVASNNYITDCGDCGIIACVRDENTITGNSIFRNGAGITLAFPVVEERGSTTIAGNNIGENKRNGIMICGGKYTILQGNSTSYNGEHGIFITDKAYDIPVTEERWPEKPVRGGGKCSSVGELIKGEGGRSSSNRIIVSNNAIIGSSQKAHNTYDNVFIRKSSDILLSGNVCYKGERDNQPRYGLNIARTCRRITVSDNILKDSGVTADLHNECERQRSLNRGQPS
ncbi:MAG: right-handed parallel beta-helix repeat-containing protein [Candidatus Latescibacteria bacterium]|nr:right-handed parallel beta-helix repeat-containing protein [Candidatus Latescibacterota bacterium]